MNRSIILLSLGLALSASASAQKKWTLTECIDHALTHNISLQKARASVETQEVNIAERRGALLPSLSASVQQGLSWRPISESANSIINNGIASSSSSRAIYNGSYGINASWTAWNGGRNQMNIENATLSRDIAALSVEQNCNSIAEQIAQQYIRILYMEEALKVNEQLLEHDRTIYQRGLDMVEQGQMSRSDLVQLEAQVASGEYDVVNTRTLISQTKLALKQLLELDPADDIEVMAGEVTDAKALSLIPDKMDIYAYALDNRPEIRSADIAITQSQLATRIAKAQRYPTINLNAGVTDSHNSGGSNNVGSQLRNNLGVAVSAGIQIPILDQRQSKSAVQRAQVSALTAQLDRQDAEKRLYQTIEQYWLDATSNQQKYIASKSKVRSMATNYELLEDQFRLGMKNIVDLLQARGNLLNAQQSNLQDKYTTVLNMLLLDFYNGSALSL